MYINKDFFIGVNDCDLNLNITNKSILKYLEEIAGIHSNMAGYGVYDIPTTHKTWIALGWKVEILRRPKYSEQIYIRTWCKEDKKALYSYRDFEVKDSNENIIIKATSKWCLIDSQKRCIMKIPNEINSDYGTETENIFEEKNEFKFREIEEKTKTKEILIDESQIDYNNHVHNTNYIELAEKGLLEQGQLFSNFEIMYKKEIKLADKINLYYNKNEEGINIITIKSEDNKFLHSIVKFY